MNKINKLILLFAVVFIAVSCSKKEHSSLEQKQVSEQDNISHYTCGMHPEVKISVEEYKKEAVFCSICNMKLVPVLKKQKQVSEQDNISHYTCGMHPEVKISVEEYKKEPVPCPICNMKLVPVLKKQVVTEEQYYGCGMKGAEHVFLIKDIKNMLCPMCGMDLIKLSEQEALRLKGVVSRVAVSGKQAKLAGVEVEKLEKRHMFKEIRAVGKVAYDPQLVIAQEEYISALTALDKIKQGDVAEIEERSSSLVESSKRKLRLLGLSLEQIEKLGQTRDVETSLILPEKKMWVYGDVYESELSWIKVGDNVKVTTSSFPGQEFSGKIASINPVLDTKTRSVKFRAEVDNLNLKLKPEMYVDVTIMSMYIFKQGEHEVLAIPKNAVLDTGLRKIVWVREYEGKYEGREVKVGPIASAVVDGKSVKFYPVLEGLAEGELVVTKANFLIDSQSQLSGVAASAYGGAVGVDEKAHGYSH